MTIIAPLPFTLANGTPNDASQVMADLNHIIGQVNANAQESIDVTFVPTTSQSVDYTTVAADAGTTILHPSTDAAPRTFTIDKNADVPYTVGTLITFVNQNGAGVLTIAIDTDTMRLAGAGSVGSRTLAANGRATAQKIATAEWLISGVGLT